MGDDSQHECSVAGVAGRELIVENGRVLAAAPQRSVQRQVEEVGLETAIMIEVNEFVERLCLLGADRGPRRFPRKFRDREILLKSIRMLLDSERSYSEPEINIALQNWSREVAPAIDIDHVSLRRTMIDYGDLERTADGRHYRVGFPPRPMLFGLEVEDVDVRATIAAYRAHQARVSAARRTQHATRS